MVRDSLYYYDWLLDYCGLGALDNPTLDRGRYPESVRGVET